MANLELKKVSEHSNRTYYLVNNYLPVMCHLGWTLVRGRDNYKQPPFILVGAPSFDNVEELVRYWHDHIAPQRVRDAKELIEFCEGLKTIL